MDHVISVALLTVGPLVLLPLLMGWGLDRVLGDPEKGFHPIVLFGQLIAEGERRWNRGTHRKRNGALLAVSLVVGTFVLTAVGLAAMCAMTWLVIATLERIAMGCVALFHGSFPGTWDVWMFLAVEWVLAFFLLLGPKSLGVFYCLAGKTLRKEVRMVFEACDRSLEEGRKQVARIVGRDTSELSEQEVRTAALETLAENLSDGVIAPLFWFLVLGLPGMMAYKMVNTLDSMIGYQNERYKDFGCWAAKMDDVANYIPARLTAFLMVAVTGRWGLLAFVKRFGRQHASPNSGYPESALAGILNCRFGGPHNYFGEYFWKPYIGVNERPLTSEDMEQAIRVNSRVETVMVVLVVLLIFAAAYCYAVWPGNVAKLLFFSLLH